MNRDPRGAGSFSHPPRGRRLPIGSSDTMCKSEKKNPPVWAGWSRLRSQESREELGAVCSRVSLLLSSCETHGCLSYPPSTCAPPGAPVHVRSHDSALGPLAVVLGRGVWCVLLQLLAAGLSNSIAINLNKNITKASQPFTCGYGNLDIILGPFLTFLLSLSLSLTHSFSRCVCQPTHADWLTLLCAHA